MLSAQVLKEFGLFNILNIDRKFNQNYKVLFNSYIIEYLNIKMFNVFF